MKEYNALYFHEYHLRPCRLNSLENSDGKVEEIPLQEGVGNWRRGGYMTGVDRQSYLVQSIRNRQV